MGRGLFSGMVWGIVVAGLVLVVLALVGPPPERPGEAPVAALSGGPEPVAPVAPEPETAPVAVPAAPAPGVSVAPEGVAATDIELPPGSEFNRPPPETEASLPETEEEPRATPSVQPPEPAGMAEVALPETAPAEAPSPETAGPAAMPAPEEAEAPQTLVAEEPVQPTPEVAAPPAPAAEPAPESPPPAPVERAGTQTPLPDAAPEAAAPQDARADDMVESAEADVAVEPEEIPDTAPAPASEQTAQVPAVATEKTESASPERTAPSVPEPAETTPSQEPVVTAETPEALETAQAPDPGRSLPRIRPLPGTDRDVEVPEPAVEETAPEAETAETAAPPAGALRLTAPGADSTAPKVRIGRLPTIGGAPAESETAVTAETAAVAPPAPRLGALARNAIPFAASGDRPLFSVILVDVGGEGLDREALMTFSFPITFAVDPTRPDAAEAMAAYREAGYEVVALAAGLPTGARPQDLEVTLTQELEKLGAVVALMDMETGGFQDDRALTAQAVDLVGATGHGLVTYDRGLNSAARLAGQAGVPQATVFRVLDADRPNAMAIRRMLDRAVFKARQDGQVVLVGHSYSETVTALYSWALEAEAEEVDLAPISAVLRLP